MLNFFRLKTTSINLTRVQKFSIFGCHEEFFKEGAYLLDDVCYRHILLLAVPVCVLFYKESRALHETESLQKNLRFPIICLSGDILQIHLRNGHRLESKLHYLP